MIELNLLVPIDEASDYVLELTGLENIKIELKSAAPSSMNPGMSYSTGFEELTTIVIATLGTLTALTSLATVIFQYKLEKAKQKNMPKEEKSPIIIVNHNALNVNEFNSPEELAEQIIKLLDS